MIWERVRSYTEVLQDPQNLVNGYVTEVEVPGVGAIPTVGNLVTMSETPGSTKGAPPQLGEGNEEVLAWAGVAGDEIAAVSHHATAAPYCPLLSYV